MSISKLYQKTYQTLRLPEVWAKALGYPEDKGCWLIYGPEKNGKTWFTLMMASVLSSFHRVVYVSAEEGIGKTFQDNCRRAGLDVGNRRLVFVEYTPIGELCDYLGRKRSARIIILDNATIYNDELGGKRFRQLLKGHPDKLFILVAHEERKQPYTATAVLAKKLAQIIVRVEGLACQVSGRCPGGILTIDDSKAKIYYGNNLKNDTEI